MYHPPTTRKLSTQRRDPYARYGFASVEVDLSNLTDEELEAAWNTQDAWMGQIETTVNQTIKQSLSRFPAVEVDTNVVLIDHGGRLDRIRKKNKRSS